MIEIRNLKKSFKKCKVLDGVDLDIQKGETLVILGRSGTGKSVLLKHIIGITKPMKGPSISMETGSRICQAQDFIKPSSTWECCFKEQRSLTR
jgi:ABC-type transporter Mla maintaining outer membrane lipid asymmetry ATPase subunit MlaF